MLSSKLCRSDGPQSENKRMQKVRKILRPCYKAKTAMVH